MQKHKIVRVIARMNIGGPAHHVAILSSAFNNARWETVLVTGQVSASEADACYLLEKYPCRLIRIPQMQRSINPLKDLAAFLKIFWILRQERPDILHTHTAKAGALGRTAGILYRLTTRRPLKIAHTFHGHALEGYFQPWANRLFLGIERFLAKRTDKLIAVSEAVKEDLLRLGAAAPEKVEVIPLGLNLENLIQLSNGHPPPGKPLRIGFVGRLVPIKEPGIFLKAIRELSLITSLPDIETVVVGDGELRPSLEEESRRLGLTSRVQFLGWRQDLASIYQSMDVVCLTSRNEGTPVSLIEALAASKPVISTDVGGVRDILNRRGKNPSPSQESSFSICDHGLLVRSGDHKGLAKGLEFLIKESSLRQEMGRRGRLYVREKYGADRLIQDIHRLYESLVSS